MDVTTNPKFQSFLHETKEFDQYNAIKSFELMESQISKPNNSASYLHRIYRFAPIWVSGFWTFGLLKFRIFEISLQNLEERKSL